MRLTMYLLDTKVISELRRGKANASVHVLAWASQVAHAEQYVSAITVMELEIGVQRIVRRDPAQGQRLRAWLDGVLRVFEGRVLAVDLASLTPGYP